MTAIGGSIESLTLNGRNFAIAADAEATRKIGGFENEVMSNGDSTARLIKTRVPLSIEGLTAVVDDSRGDHEFLQDLADLNDFFPFALTYPSGEVWQGTGQITSDLTAGSQNTTATVNLMGPGKLTRQ